MAIKRKSASKEGRVRVNKLKIKRDKVEELVDKEAKRIRGGVDGRTQPNRNFTQIESPH